MEAKPEDHNPPSSGGLETVPQERLKPSEQWPQVRQTEESDPKYIINKPFYCDEKIYVSETDLPEAVEQEGHVYPEVTNSSPVSPLSSNDSIRKPTPAEAIPQPLYKRRKKWFIGGGLILIVIIAVSLTVPLVLLNLRNDAGNGGSQDPTAIQVVTVTVGGASTADQFAFTNPISMAAPTAATEFDFPVAEPSQPGETYSVLLTTVTYSDSTTTATYIISATPGVQTAILPRAAEPEPEMTPAPAPLSPRAPPYSAKRRRGLRNGWEEDEEDQDWK
ncbi:hypothetical protein QBC44DRAFT_310635 [Cladorrhinum sp. PSN332]|nr:hypothetical protein QBC44DRAFT_310635 [Cladorrhinum sp. PSN332]